MKQFNYNKYTSEKNNLLNSNSKRNNINKKSILFFRIKSKRKISARAYNNTEKIIQEMN